MEMIYYGGIGSSFMFPEKIDLLKKSILSYKVKNLKGWKSPNLVIVFTDGVFEQPTPLIVNYEDVIKFLNNNSIKTKR